MKYPNAADGVKKIFVSEVIGLAASVLAVISSVTGLLFYDDLRFAGLAAAAVIALLVAGGVYAAAYILEIVGILRAGRDESAFKVSLFSIIALLVLTLAGEFFYGNHVVSFIIEIAEDVAQFFLVHYIIHGIMHISERLGKPEMTKKGNNIFRVIYIAIGFEIIVRVFELIFGKELGESLSMAKGWQALRTDTTGGFMR